MHRQCLIAQFDNTQQARLGLEVLAKAGYGEKHVSFVSRRDAPELTEVTRLEETAAGESKPSMGLGIGGLLGGALTAPVAASTLIGPFILIGPLVGAGFGAAIGSLLGGAHGWGVTPDATAGYEESVRSGAVLVIVNGDDAELNEAEASLKTTGPASLRRYALPQSAET